MSVCFTAGTRPLSSAIQILNPSELADGTTKRAAINHVLVRFTFPGVVLISESHTRHGVAISPESHLTKAVQGGRVARYIVRPLAMCKEDRRRAWERAEGLHGRGYDGGLIVRYAAAKLGGPFEKLLARQNPDRFTCNEHATELLQGLCGQLPADASESIPLKNRSPEKLFRLFHGMSSREWVALHG